MDPTTEKPKRVVLDREEEYRFHVRFEGVDGRLVTDESPPLGKGDGPSPAHLLGAAVGNCLAASLVFCLGKSRVALQGLQAEVAVSTGRNEQGRLRITGIKVDLTPRVASEEREKMGRCLELFQSFCTVSESVRHGIDVEVSVNPQDPASAEG